MLHHAPPLPALGAEAGRRIRVVYGLPGFRQSMVEETVLPPGVGLLNHIALGCGHTPLMLSAVSFGVGAKCLPRDRAPSFDTAAKVERLLVAAGSLSHLGQSVGGPMRTNWMRHGGQQKKNKSRNRCV